MSRPTQGRIITFAIAITIVFSCTNAFAQSDLSVINESRKFVRSEIAPLQKKVSDLNSEFHRKNGLEAQILDRLKNADESSLEKIRSEMQNLSDRLEMLQQVENILSDMNPDAIPEAIAESKKRQSQLLEQRGLESKPYQEEQAQLIQDTRPKNDQLAKAMETIVAATGKTKFPKFERLQSSANFGYSTYVAGFKKSKDAKVVNISIHLVTDEKWNLKEIESIDGNFMISQLNDISLIAKYKSIQINVYDSGKQVGKDKLKSFVVELVDLEQLAKFAD